MRFFPIVFVAINALASPAAAKATPIDEIKEVLATAAAKHTCQRHSDCAVYVGFYSCCGSVTGAYPKGSLKASELKRLDSLAHSLLGKSADDLCDCVATDAEPFCKENHCTLWQGKIDSAEHAVYQYEIYAETNPKAAKKFELAVQNAEKLVAKKDYKAAHALLTSVPPAKGSREGDRLFQIGLTELHTGKELESIRSFTAAADVLPQLAGDAAYNVLCAWSLSGRADDNNYRGTLLGLRTRVNDDSAAMKRYVKMMSTDPDLAHFRAWKLYSKYVPSWLLSEKPMDYE